MSAKRQIFLGTGAGQCGMNLLAEILGQQASSRITLEQRPLLPWNQPAGQPGIRERMERWAAKHEEQILGDVATFYLPYVEQAIAFDPDVRIVCLQRPCDEIVAAYCRQIDQHFSVPTDHWSAVPAPGWSHDPLWTRTFPQYDAPDRVTALRMYYDDYYTRANDLARRFPANFRLIASNIFYLTATALIDIVHLSKNVQ